MAARRFKESMRGVLAIAAAGIMIWGPMLLALIGLVPTGGRLPAGHLAAASAQTLIALRILHKLFVIPVARATPGRYRIVPRSPRAPLLLASLGLATGLAGFWEATGGGSSSAAILAVPGSLLLFFAATHLRRRPLWGGFLTAEGGRLCLEVPAGSYCVPIQQIRCIYRRRDGSFYTLTPRPDRNTLVLTRRARGSYWVEGAGALLEALGEGVPIEEVDSLLQVMRRAR